MTMLRRGILAFATILAVVPVLILSGRVLADDSSDPLEEIRALIKAHQFAEAETAARALLTRVEAEKGSDSIEAARVCDRLVEVLIRQGKGSDDDTLKLAERAV